MKNSRVIRYGCAGLGVLGSVVALSSCSSTPSEPLAVGGSSAGGAPSASAGSLGAVTAGTSASAAAGSSSSAGAPSTAGSSSSTLSGGAGGNGSGGGLPSGGAGAASSGGASGGPGGATSSAGNVGAGGASGGSPSGFGGGGGQPPAFNDGQQGFATRYWDCCKPACGWKGNVGGRTPVQACSVDDKPLSNYDAKNACENGGEAYMCHSVQPWAVSDTLAYGFAAVSVNKGDYCGRCYQLQFTGSSHSGGDDPGSKSLMGKTMIIQAINNGGVEGNQFDLLVPGGGVGLLNACSKQWGTSDLGEQYGGFYLACQKSQGDYAKARECAKKKCESVFASKPDLLVGCEWFTSWFGAADNPNVSFKEVTCPEAITQMSGLKR